MLEMWNLDCGILGPVVQISRVDVDFSEYVFRDELYRLVQFREPVVGSSVVVAISEKHIQSAFGDYATHTKDNGAMLLSYDQIELQRATDSSRELANVDDDCCRVWRLGGEDAREIIIANDDSLIGLRAAILTRKSGPPILDISHEQDRFEN